jgi:hypothetical protein
MNKKILAVVLSVLAAAALYPPAADALYYYGGNGDGFDTAAGGTGWIVSMASTAEQTFLIRAATTPIYALAVTQEGGCATGGITAANGILVKIPAALNMTWDTTDTTATVTGSAASKVSAAVSYPDPKSLLIAVSSDFADSDSIAISGLAFTSFNSPGRNYLALYTDGGTLTATADARSKIISMSDSPATFTGGPGTGFSSRPDFDDCGLSYYNGTTVMPVPCEPLGTLTSALRISVNAVSYGVVLVDPADPKASGLKINTTGGVKSLRKF